MVAAGRAQIRLCDEAARPRSDLLPQPVKLRLVWREVERFVIARDIVHFGPRKADEADARVAVMVGLAAAHRAGQPLLAVKAIPRRQNDVASRIALEARP